MNKDLLERRYKRIYNQLSDLLLKTNDRIARMATIVALLHHKMPHFFWTGFYRIVNGELIVGPYQGPLACQVLEKNKGVCWACINRRETIIVPDVEKFPGHIACDPRSRSEITVPLWEDNKVYGVLDVDSKELNAFCEIDRFWLEKIVKLL
ncbi:GAF domain-containing protein [Candidatus Aminicenantes bacterium AC-708-M15]|jgi:GAF domain-containing protein|nr:GAF domain-containing protein [SCandidatus Aminicenantes bacterium Aminicenantia_JdfR_composite]MCP2597526.1 GAF domain-containing protein [Candidatus Aminicenantes bacterium AC-335-G13]MCP2598456.1 GAF domain-containing protein [Candidatus Aminicenantes bacterium AC-335-L06]MCP2604168.1 GAF domain-containing protein [Candidatus Aminicenantes bacterium AC-708-M15]MCP2605491.1 GAF domain-containing protein [Candidatus Aminicenantes bacterium AC-335-O07]MCP2618577.1 GAF domain-containing prot